MTSSVKTLSLIKARFPGREEFVEHTYWQDISFRSLCKDYRDCFAALERWRQLGSADALGRQLEYAELLEELDGEIRGWLRDVPDD